MRDSGIGSGFPGNAAAGRGGAARASRKPMRGRRRDNERERRGKEENGDKSRRGDGDVVRSAQRASCDTEKRLDDDHEDGCLDAEKGRFHHRDFAVIGVADAEPEHDQGAGEHEQKAGGETAERAVKPPADIGGELHRLGTGKKHAKVQRMQEALFRDPPPLIDEQPMHQRDLTRGSAEGQDADPAPHRERFGKAWPG